MFDLGPITAINGVALDLSTTPEVTGKRTSSAKLVSYEPGRGRSSIFALQFRRERISPP
jgi:hypothetical protein